MESRLRPPGCPNTPMVKITTGCHLLASGPPTAQVHLLVLPFVDLLIQFTVTDYSDSDVNTPALAQNDDMPIFSNWATFQV